MKPVLRVVDPTVEGTGKYIDIATEVFHMVSLEDDPQIQWESYWATLTFEVTP